MDENTGTPVPAEGTPAVIEGPPLPEALRNVDPAKLSEIRKKLDNFIQNRGKTMSGSESPDGPPGPPAATEPTVGGVENDKPVGETMTGADVDWSEYDLNYDVAHLYKRATFRDTPQGPKWVVMLDEYYTTERAFKQHGRNVNRPGSNDKENTEPLNLGEYLTQMVNGVDGWNVAAIMPGTSGNAGVILRKPTPVVLPDPTPLKKEEEVEAPTDPELQATEDAALEFAQEEGLTPPPVVAEDEVGEAVDEQAAQLASRFRTRAEVGLEPGEVLEARVGEAAQRAIDLNRGNPDSVRVDAPKGEQPAPELPSRGAQGELFLGAAGVENVREGMRKLLEDGTLPQA